MTGVFTAGSVLTAANLNTAINSLTLNAQTGSGASAYSFVLTDAGKLVTASNAAVGTYTIPLNSSIAFATGTVIELLNIGAGTVTLAGAGGVTLTGSTSAPQSTRLRITKTGTDTWYSNALGGGGGLVYVGGATISASSSTIISSCFSAAYDNYLLMLDNVTVASGSGNILMQLRTGGTTAATNYNWQLSEVSSTTYTGLRTAGTTSVQILQASTTAGATWVTLNGPFLARATLGQSKAAQSVGGAAPILDDYVWSHTTATSYESVALSPSASTFSGTLKIFGYSNS